MYLLSALPRLRFGDPHGAQYLRRTRFCAVRPGCGLSKNYHRSPHPFRIELEERAGFAVKDSPIPFSDGPAVAGRSAGQYAVRVGAVTARMMAGALGRRSGGVSWGCWGCVA